jgi:hypothetical protein
VQVTTDSKGKTKTTETALVVNAVLSDAHAEFLRQFSAQVAADSENEEEDEGEESLDDDTTTNRPDN